MITDDSLSFDIFSQAVQAVRSPVGVDPMGGLNVERVIAIGASASAARLVTYHNSIHPLAGVLDAFLVGEGGGSLRTDLTVKVLKLLSESEIAGIAGTNQVTIRQPGSDHFRRWEVAGTSHIDLHGWHELAPLVARDLSPLSPPVCNLPPFSRIPSYFVSNAATEQLVRWVTDNYPATQRAGYRSPDGRIAERHCAR
jgi:hypothetical protein